MRSWYIAVKKTSPNFAIMARETPTINLDPVHDEWVHVIEKPEGAVVWTKADMENLEYALKFQEKSEALEILTKKMEGG